jgi:glycosyltransferase involved in cell wall biosynthesis
LFIGSFQHTPNIDAALFFTEEIFPLVRRKLPAIRFYIIGDKAPPEVIVLAEEDVVVTGYQADVSSYFDRIKLSVAPLRFGADVKGKINQSIGFGVPVVATSLGIEGMDLEDRVHVMVAENPQDFANAVIELYQSEELWRTISAKSVEKIRESYSVEAARRGLQRLISDEGLPSGTLRAANEVSPGIELSAAGARP